jgi:hypothetical protein
MSKIFTVVWNIIQEVNSCTVCIFFLATMRLELGAWKSCLLLVFLNVVNPLNTELNPICHLLALLGAHHFLHVRRVRVKLV